jgi:hypothetical protein
MVRRTIDVHQVEILFAQAMCQLMPGASACRPAIQAVGKRLIPYTHALNTLRLTMKPAAWRRSDMNLVVGNQRLRQSQYVTGVAAAISIMEIGEQELHSINLCGELHSAVCKLAAATQIRHMGHANAIRSGKAPVNRSNIPCVIGTLCQTSGVGT